VIFRISTTIQFILGVVLTIVYTRYTLWAVVVTMPLLDTKLCMGTLSGECYSSGLIFHPHTVSYSCPLRVSEAWVAWHKHTIPIRAAYICLSLGHGKDIHPPSLLGFSQLPYRRRCVAPRSGSTFLLDVWFKVNLVDPSENANQRFRSILPGGHCIALPDDLAVRPMGRSLGVSTSWTSRPRMRTNTHTLGILILATRTCSRQHSPSHLMHPPHLPGSRQ